MDELILSINKISLLAFIITFGFLVYEFRLLKKEKKSISKPQIPKFNSTNPTVNQFQNMNIQNNNYSSKTNNTSVNRIMIIILIIMLVFFALYTFTSMFKKDNTNNNINNIQTNINVLVSKGIKIYNDKEVEIRQNQLDQVTIGTNLKIGVESIQEADIDKARIRVNESIWLPTHETKNYDNKLNIYYINYQIATISAQLKIEAQLHSLKDGWLGD